jgi:hypothetical protein
MRMHDIAGFRWAEHDSSSKLWVTWLDANSLSVITCVKSASRPRRCADRCAAAICEKLAAHYGDLAKPPVFYRKKTGD